VTAKRSPRAQGPRESIVYSEKYYKHAMTIQQEFLPVLKHTGGAVVARAELMEAGKVEIAGVRQEYQILKVYFKP
jgi:hypothetical protein